MSEDLFYKAMESQISWKIELMYHLDDDPGVLFDTDLVNKGGQFALGQWLNSTGHEYRHLPSYRTLVNIYEKVHKCAADVIRAKDEGNTQQAVELFKNQYMKLSSKITHVLVRLNSSVNGFNNQLLV